MRLNETRISGDRRHVFERWIEPLDMTDLQNDVPGSGEFYQFGRLRGVFGHRFLKQNVFPAVEKKLGNFEVRAGGSDNAEGLGAIRGLLDRFQNASSVLF